MGSNKARSLEFLMTESCGKCVPCREGLPRMLSILNDICDGDGKEGDVELLYELADGMSNASLCALGSTAANPVLTTLKYFKEEYLAHVKEKRCPAKVCRALVTYTILPDKCTGCTMCAKACPENAISGEKKKPHKIDQPKCVKCGICLDTCKFDAIEIK